MSLTTGGPGPVRGATALRSAPAARRRVRQEVREGLAVVAFSAVASTGVALALLLLMVLVG